MFPLISVLAAIAAAISLGVSDVLEQRATHAVPARAVALDPRLLTDLATKPLWLAGIGADIAGLALQVTALRFGPLALVQPILVTSLLFAVLISAGLGRRKPDRVTFTGTLGCAAGLAAFLAAARPHAGTVAVTPLIVLPLAAVLAGILAFCAVTARVHRRARPLAIALAAGVVFGVTAFLFKEVPQTLGQGFSHPARQWALYALVILLPAGFLLSQSAFQAGTLLAPVLAIITVSNPLVAIGIAQLWLNERIASSPADIAAEAAGLAVMTAGVIALAHRSPQLTGPGS